MSKSKDARQRKNARKHKPTGKPKAQLAFVKLSMKLRGCTSHRTAATRAGTTSPSRS